MEIKYKEYLKKPLIWAICVVIIAVACGSIIVYPYFVTRSSKDAMLYIYPTMSVENLTDSLKTKCGESFGDKVLMFIKMNDINMKKSVGAYKISTDESPSTVAKRLKSGLQTPIKFTFNNVRTKEQFAERVARKFLMTKEEMLAAMNNDSILKKLGYNNETIVAVLMPDSYEYYWNIKPEKLLESFKSHSDKWWNDERKAQAKSLGLSTVEIATVASIVEEETANSAEKGAVARLYLNRIKKGMKLQADPTVKFAIGDFTVRRVLVDMLKFDSPYNTYLYAGLPPAPIRIPAKSTLDAVLTAPMHDYIFMCAKEDFSGTHRFTSSYGEHMKNARKYQAALNARGIKR